MLIFLESGGVSRRKRRKKKGYTHNNPLINSMTSLSLAGDVIGKGQEDPSLEPLRNPRRYLRRK